MSGINLRPAEEQHSSGDDTHSPVPLCSSALLFHDDAPLVLRQSWVFRPCPLLGVRESPQYSALPDITALGVGPGCSSRTLLPSAPTPRHRSLFPLPTIVDLWRSSLVLGRGGDVCGLVLCWEPAREEDTRPFCTSPPPVWGPGDHLKAFLSYSLLFLLPFPLSVTPSAFTSLSFVSPSLSFLLAVLFFLLLLFSGASSSTSSPFPRPHPHPYPLQLCISNRPRATMSAFAERLYATP